MEIKIELREHTISTLSGATNLAGIHRFAVQTQNADLNSDGQFDSRDFVQILTSGKYDTNQAAT